MKDIKLINQNFLEKKLRDDKEIIKDNSQIFLKWHNETRNERKIQANFLNDIFGKILGYEIETDKEYSLDKDCKTQKDGTKVDGIEFVITSNTEEIRLYSAKSTCPLSLSNGQCLSLQIKGKNKGSVDFWVVK